MPTRFGRPAARRYPPPYWSTFGSSLQRFTQPIVSVIPRISRRKPGCQAPILSLLPRLFHGPRANQFRTRWGKVGIDLLLPSLCLTPLSKGTNLARQLSLAGLFLLER